MAGMAGEREREQDIRVYEQIPAAMELYKKNKVWGIGTEMDRLEKGNLGPIGRDLHQAQYFGYLR